MVELRDDEDNTVHPIMKILKCYALYKYNAMYDLLVRIYGAFCNIVRINQKTIKSKFAISSNVVMRI